MFMFPSQEPERSRDEEQHLRRIFTLNCTQNVHVPGPEWRNMEWGTCVPRYRLLTEEPFWSCTKGTRWSTRESAMWSSERLDLDVGGEYISNDIRGVLSTAVLCVYRHWRCLGNGYGCLLSNNDHFECYHITWYAHSSLGKQVKVNMMIIVVATPMRWVS
jgi:hypothetical protein